MYEGATALLTSETHAAGLLAGFAVTRTFDALQRLSGVSTSGAQPTPLTQATYAYDAASRLQTVTAGANTITYGYVGNAALVETATFKHNGTTRLLTTTTYDRLNRLETISSASSGGGPASSYAYAYNAANQRTRVTQQDNAYWNYGYDALGQVTSGKKFLADNTAALGLDYAWTYDDIGNRKTASVNSQLSTLSSNLLNQYTQRMVPGAVGVLGAAAEGTQIAVTVGDNTGAAQRQGETFYRQVAVNNTNTAQHVNVRAAAGQSSGTPLVAVDTRSVFVAKTPEVFAHDADGNLASDARWVYTWDGENRLVAMETQATAAAAGASCRRLEFVYDGQGRRISKKVFDWNGSAWVLATETRFLYDGWTMLAEFSGNPALNATRSYTWGLDLSGTLQGAGGVGGLLAVTDVASSTTHFVSCDGNGNVVGLTDAGGGALTGKYDYNAFGEPMLIEGSFAGGNSFRFSSKYTDAETGHLYYGYRFYAPEMGRWLSRDPIGEAGGVNLYSYCANDPINGIDPWGLEVVGVYSKSKGTVTLRDTDTGKSVTYPAESGGKPYGAPIPSGSYEILERAGRPGFYRLDPIDSIIRDDRDQQTGRDAFRLHGPGRTIGCVAAKDKDPWEEARKLIDSTKTKTVPDFYHGSPSGPIKRYGFIRVVD